MRRLDNTRFGRWRRKDRRGQQFAGMALFLLLGLVLFLTFATEVVRGTNERADRRRANLASEKQFVRAEQSVLGAAQGAQIVLSSYAVIERADAAGNPTGISHAGWDDDDPSAWSSWHSEPGELCDLDDVDSCWQFRFEDAETNRIRANISLPERNVVLRSISGCRSESLAPSLNMYGMREPSAYMNDLELAQHCDDVSRSEHRYRKRSFTSFAMHFASQEATPRQGGGLVPFDSTLVLGSGTPIHTNQEHFIICGWPDLGSHAEISVIDPLLRDSTIPLANPEDGVEVSDGSCPLGSPPPWINIYRGGPLEVSETAEHDRPTQVARCAQTLPAALLWMTDARERAVEIANLINVNTYLGVIPHNDTVDLSTLPSWVDEFVLYGVGDLTVTGQAAYGTSVSVVATGDITIKPVLATPSSMAATRNAELVFGVADWNFDDVVALVAGCDVKIADPVSVSLDGDNHDVFLHRLAVLAPFGGMFPDAYLTAAEANAPTVHLEGSIASGYWGNYGTVNITTGTQVTGYNFDLEYPFDWADVTPPWWPDPLGGEWQPLY